MTADYRAQIKRAEALDDKELARHAAVGRICKCNDCFCCAAEHVKYVRENNARSMEKILKSFQNVPILLT